MGRTNGSSSLAKNTIKELHKSLIKRETSVTNLCNDSLGLINQLKHLNPFITVCQNEALEQARQLDKVLLSAGDNNNNDNNNGHHDNNDDDSHKKSINQRLVLSPRSSPLFGVPISIKDNFCTEQVLTTCGSKMLHNYVPPYSATAVTRLRQAGCVMVGKTNMDEFAMGSSCTTSYYGPAVNHWKSDSMQGRPAQLCEPSEWFMAGGSSTGSAVSVASGACFASLGTDTGGSTRQPASLTGVVGFKPTYGLISRFGLVPLVHSLDVVSILARSVDDVHLVFDAIVGQDENDLTSVNHKTELKPCQFTDHNDDSSYDNYTTTKTTTTTTAKRTIRVGIPEEFIKNGDMSVEVSHQFNETLRCLLDSGGGDDLVNFELVKLSLPHARYATECYTIISSAEIASNMSCYDGVKFGLSTGFDQVSPHAQEFNRDQYFKANRDAGFGSEVKKRILLGNYFMLSQNRDKYLVQALKLRRLISDEFNKAFTENRVHVMLMPSTPTTSVSHEEWLRKQDNNKLFHEDYFLIPSNLANLPSISLPVGFSPTNGLPIGLQLIANKFCDLDLLSISKLFEARAAP